MKSTSTYLGSRWQFHAVSSLLLKDQREATTSRARRSSRREAFADGRVAINVHQRFEFSDFALDQHSKQRRSSVRLVGVVERERASWKAAEFNCNGIPRDYAGDLFCREGMLGGLPLRGEAA